MKSEKHPETCSAIRIEITQTMGSTPREKGALMWVYPDGIKGSIGGGNLEFAAIQRAREMLISGESSEQMEYQLGPESGQCCGGRMTVEFSAGLPEEQPTQLIAIFGAGHIAAKIAQMSAAFPFEVKLYDTRDFVELSTPVPYKQVALPEKIIDALPSGATVLIMTHDHGLDFLLAERALLRDDLGFIGMIGSKSKAARFRSQFSGLGEERLSRLHAPIAKRNDDKRPEAIALIIISELFAK